MATLEDRPGDRDRRKKLLRREADRLNERATTAEGYLSEGDARVCRERSGRLRLYLFDAELSANVLSETALRYATSERGFPPEIRDSLLRALRELRAALDDATRDVADIPAACSQGIRQTLEELESRRRQRASGEEDGWPFQIRLAEAAIRQLSGGAGEEREQDPEDAESETEPGEKDGERGEEDRREGGFIERLRPTTIQGLQATLASGLALLAGLAISPSRPYWVVLMAFVVFMGSGTVGDTLSRGVQRTVGTLLGAGVGFLLASAVSGNLYVSVFLIVACIFLAFYLFPISQALLMFWITVLLAVAFGLLGRLGGGILVVRAYDTLVGSAIGVAVSLLVLPTKTGDKIREGAADFLDALKGYLRDRVDRLAGGDPSRHPVEEAREVESKPRQVTQNAATARRQYPVFGRSKADLDRQVTALTALNYYARRLADPANRGQRLEDPEDQHRRSLLKEAGERIAANLDSFHEAITAGKQPEIRDIEDLMQQLEGTSDHRPARSAGENNDPSDPEEHADALYYLRRINRTPGELSTTPGIGSKRRGSGRS